MIGGVDYGVDLWRNVNERDVRVVLSRFKQIRGQSDWSFATGGVCSWQVEHRVRVVALGWISVPRTAPFRPQPQTLVEQADIVIASATQVA